MPGAGFFSLPGVLLIFVRKALSDQGHRGAFIFSESTVAGRPIRLPTP